MENNNNLNEKFEKHLDNGEYVLETFSPNSKVGMLCSLLIGIVACLYFLLPGLGLLIASIFAKNLRNIFIPLGFGFIGLCLLILVLIVLSTRKIGSRYFYCCTNKRIIFLAETRISSVASITYDRIDSINVVQTAAQRKHNNGTVNFMTQNIQRPIGVFSYIDGPFEVRKRIMDYINNK